MINFHEDERLILEQRKHWYVIASESFILAISALAPPFIVILLTSISSNSAAFILANLPMIIFLIFFWILVMWIFFFIAWTNYYLDVLVITNKRIIDIEQLGLFARDQAEMRLENVQDVKVEVVGFMQSLLRLGDIHIQSAGQMREVLAKGFPDPHRIKSILVRAQDEVLKKKNNEQ